MLAKYKKLLSQRGVLLRTGRYNFITFRTALELDKSLLKSLKTFVLHHLDKLSLLLHVEVLYVESLVQLADQKLHV